MRNSASTMRHDETALTVAGEPVRCYRAGLAAGPVLVLLHGEGPDSALAAWAPVWPALTAHARLVAPDLPGCGGSPLGTTAPTVEGYHAWLLRFLDACGIRRATIAGRALGAQIARRTALDTPARVAGLVLLVPGDGPDRVAGELIAHLAEGEKP
jgi:pimeloyl-ACP methyl ester carboxylesterase